MRVVRDATKHRKGKASVAMYIIYDRQLSVNSLVLDMIHTLRALDLRHLVLDKGGYIKTILQQLVVLIAAFDEKINSQFYGKEVQDAISEIDSLIESQISTNTKVREILKEYNRHVEPHRKTLKFVRNTIGAHRDISDPEIQRAIQQLGEDWIVSTTNQILILITDYGYIVGQAIVDLGDKLRKNPNILIEVSS